MSAKKSILHEVCREFWFPLSAASIWALYEWANAANADKTLSTSVKAFGGAFFFVSWLLSQWFRIRKQQRLEGGLSSIEANVIKTLKELESRTKDLSCYITGGESVCFFALAEDPDDKGSISRIALRHQGAHPLYEITARISDCDADLTNFGPDATFMQIFEAQKHVDLQNLAPGLVSMVPLELELGTSGRRHFNVRFYARNGDFTQLLRFEKIGKRWLLATRVIRNDSIVYEQIPKNFSINEQGTVDW